MSASEANPPQHCQPRTVDPSTCTPSDFLLNLPSRAGAAPQLESPLNKHENRALNTSASQANSHFSNPTPTSSARHVAVLTWSRGTPSAFALIILHTAATMLSRTRASLSVPISANRFLSSSGYLLSNVIKENSFCRKRAAFRNRNTKWVVFVSGQMCSINTLRSTKTHSTVQIRRPQKRNSRTNVVVSHSYHDEGWSTKQKTERKRIKRDSRLKDTPACRRRRAMR